MGEDNLRSLHKWKNYQVICERHKIYVYPRAMGPGITTPDAVSEAVEVTGPNIHRIEAPIMQISSSFVRHAIAQGQDVRYILTEPVHRYVREMHFYEK